MEKQGLHSGPKLRHDNWTPIEELYATLLIKAFKAGLDLFEKYEGLSLRLFLAEELSCNPTRISKRFTGIEGLGKRFRVSTRTAAHHQLIEELRENEQLFTLSKTDSDHTKKTNQTDHKDSMGTASTHNDDHSNLIIHNVESVEEFEAISSSIISKQQEKRKRANTNIECDIQMKIHKKIHSQFKEITETDLDTISVKSFSSSSSSVLPPKQVPVITPEINNNREKYFKISNYWNENTNSIYKTEGKINQLSNEREIEESVAIKPSATPSLSLSSSSTTSSMPISLSLSDVSKNHYSQFHSPSLSLSFINNYANKSINNCYYSDIINFKELKEKERKGRDEEDTEREREKEGGKEKESADISTEEWTLLGTLLKEEYIS